MDLTSKTIDAAAKPESSEHAHNHVVSTTDVQASGFEKPIEKTVGEKLFHFVTYTGIGYLANLGVSLVIWDFFLTGKGKPVPKFIAGKAAKGLQNLGMAEHSAQSWSQLAADMACAPLGGHLTMIPVMFSENNARYCCHVANKIFDPNYQYKHIDASISTPTHELPPLVDEPDKQTLGQVAMRRGIGWGLVIASGTALGKVQGGKWKDLLENSTINVVNKGIQLSNNPTLQAMGRNDTFQRYLKMGALDSYFTVITSLATEMTKNMQFGGDSKKEEPEVQQEKKYAAIHQKQDLKERILPMEGRINTAPSGNMIYNRAG